MALTANLQGPVLRDDLYILVCTCTTSHGGWMEVKWLIWSGMPRVRVRVGAMLDLNFDAFLTELPFIVFILSPMHAHMYMLLQYNR
jgi:hypothetical protein